MKQAPVQNTFFNTFKQQVKLLFHTLKIPSNCQCSESHVQLFVTPWIIQSMEFSRPEYWSGQPFPPPGDFPNPGIKSRSPELQTDSLPAEPQGKPKNTGVGSLSLLQRIFLTQESNWGLLRCRQIYKSSNMIEDIYEKPVVSIILKGERLKNFEVKKTEK